jgi:hypothetical protein
MKVLASIILPLLVLDSAHNFTPGNQYKLIKGQHSGKIVTIISAFEQLRADELTANDAASNYVFAQLFDQSPSHKVALATRLKHSQLKNHPLSEALSQETVPDSFRVKLADGSITYAHKSWLQKIS